MSKLWPHGEEAGQNALDKFFKSKSDAVGIAKYKENRNRPDLDGTSRLSPYIACMWLFRIAFQPNERGGPLCQCSPFDRQPVWCPHVRCSVRRYP